MSDSFDPKDCSTPGLAVHCQLLEFMQTHVHWVGDVIQPSHPLSSPSPTFNLSQHQSLSNESVLHIRWPKYRSFSINSSNKYSVLIPFGIDWFDLAGTLKSLFRHHNSKALVHLCSALCMVQHAYMTTGKAIALTRRTSVGKVSAF